MKPAAIAIVKGGLGNQLFSYAAARAWALREGRELLIDDRSGFTRDGYGRSYRLDHFPIAGRPAPENLRLGDPKGFRHRFVRSLNKVLPDSQKSYFAERSGDPTTRLVSFHSKRPVVHLNGYWQDEACFADAADTIRAELEPPAFTDAGDLALEQELASTPSVFVHIRRVRYSPRLDAGYYHAAIARAREAVPGCHFEVFGDDLAWAREHLDFADAPVRFHEGDTFDELRDFRLLAACRHAIVANSSFSWWAAWLRPANTKQVWTPADPGWPVKPAKGWIPAPNGLEQDE